jgi:hypothetical protein
MKTIKMIRMTLIGVLVAVILLLVIGEAVFQYAVQSNWETFFPKEGIGFLTVDPQGQV